LAITLLLSLLTVTVAGQTNAQSNESPQGDSYALTVQQLQTILATESRGVEDLRQQDEALAQLAEVYAGTINAWKIQGTSYHSLLILPQPKLSVLTKALGNLQAALDNVEDKIAVVTEKSAETLHLQSETKKQVRSYEQYLDNVGNEPSANLYQPALRTELETLIQLMAAKKHHLDRITGTYGHLANELNPIQQEFGVLIPRFAEKIREVRTQELFERTTYPFDFPTWTNFTAELRQLTGQLKRMETRAFWIAEFSTLWRGGGLLVVAAGMLYVGLFILLLKLKRMLNAWRLAPIWADYRWCRTLISLISRSLILLGTIMFIYIYSRLREIWAITPALGVVIGILLAVLSTRWFLIILKIDAHAGTPKIPKGLMRRLRMLVLVVRYTVIVHIVIRWFLPEDTALLILGRLIFEIALIFWLLNFRSAYSRLLASGEIVPTARSKNYKPLINGLTAAIPGVAVILEALGYGTLALYWFTAWGRSLVNFLWAVLFYHALQEKDQKFYLRDKSHPGRPAQPVKWFLFRMCWLGWMVALALALIFAWGGQRAVVDGLHQVMHYTIAIGNLKINLVRLMQTALIIFFTYIIVRLGRHILQTKLLDRSGLEVGLRSSIVTISIYMAWGLGILAALYALGVSGTSLTVAFGALSIGLGFGLQNIFNNFMSGIIMLFERPIQVGDAVEINGIWGDVKKINFRSTVVQTYDNASLIIPNSDFISNQVTNWSFRDRRLRIKIDVGVAYGSDIELVRKTLLEVADTTPNVLKYPHPEVLFTEFADSSLNFVLRVWTDIDNMLKAGTAIRFEIDRLFRERGVEIPFPQRDLHMRTATAAAHSNTGPTHKTDGEH
jgi:potassium-dependent mechanosensitive channel